MTPSEMTDELISESLALKLSAENGEVYRQPVYEKAFSSYRLMRSAARTIRELLERDKERLKSHQETLERERVALDKLKIATEALEKIDNGFLEGPKQDTSQALARIKETK